MIFANFDPISQKNLLNLLVTKKELSVTEPPTQRAFNGAAHSKSVQRSRPLKERSTEPPTQRAFNGAAHSKSVQRSRPLKERSTEPPTQRAFNGAAHSKSVQRSRPLKERSFVDGLIFWVMLF